MSQISEAQLAAAIDHAILLPQLSRAEVDAQLEIAREWRVFSACVRPCDIAHAVDRLAGSGVAVGSVVGFPHGSAATTSKAAEARNAREDGAVELDMVLNIGWLRSGLDAAVADDVRAVVDAADGGVVKVILETSLLDDEQIVRACRLCDAAGADFVKTSTGFAGGGATVAQVRLMRASVGARMQVKASGGVRGLDAARAMLDAGATRLGTSATATILGEARALARGHAAPGTVDASSY